MKIAFLTLGCKVNQFETQALETEAVARGHTLTPFDAPADAYVVNTCTVTAVSDKKSRAAIRHARANAPGAVVAVCGCFAQVSPEEVRKLGVDLIAGTGERGAFLARLEAAAAERNASVYVDNALARRGFEPLPAGGMEGRTRALLKLEDGCVNFCTYCVIPYARGPVRSMPIETAVREAVRLSREGYRELVLTGIEISSYGADFKDGTGLIDVVAAVAAAAPDLRLRLGSLEPRTVTEPFARRAAALPNLCPHFHLSLQSGCDAVLTRMGRKYDTGRYLESVRLLREHLDDPAITADLIVGFPGETEDEFAQTLAFLEQCALSALHIFPYSRRPGTPAADLPRQIANAEKQSRAKRAAVVAARLQRDYLTRQVGKTYPVLFENEAAEAGQSTGNHWRGFAPNYVEVHAVGEHLHNEIRNVHITAASDGHLLGEIQDAK